MKNSSGEIQAVADLDELQARLNTTWTTGNYDLFSHYMEPGARQFFERLGVAAGSRLLDVGCGAGRVAFLAARAGALVTGYEMAANRLEYARTRAATEGLSIIFDGGDAAALPYGDAHSSSLSR